MRRVYWDFTVDGGDAWKTLRCQVKLKRLMSQLIRASILGDSPKIPRKNDPDLNRGPVYSDSIGEMETAVRAQDEWLALRCQSGEPDAFEDLVHVMERPLLYYAAKLLGNEERAGDALQDVWIRVFRGIGKLKDPASLRSWLYRITYGISVDRIRQDISRARAEEAQSEQFEETADVGFDNEDATAVHRALDQIDLRHREVLVLHFLEDFSVAEVAAVVGCPEGTVKSRMYHAKKAMKELLLRGGYGTKQ